MYITLLGPRASPQRGARDQQRKEMPNFMRRMCHVARPPTRAARTTARRAARRPARTPATRARRARNLDAPSGGASALSVPRPGLQPPPGAASSRHRRHPYPRPRRGLFHTSCQGLNLVSCRCLSRYRLRRALRGMQKEAQGTAPTNRQRPGRDAEPPAQACRRAMAASLFHTREEVPQNWSRRPPATRARTTVGSARPRY